MENNLLIFNNIDFYKIKDFDDYYISKCGKVLSTKKNDIKIMIPYNSNGYSRINLYKSKYFKFIQKRQICYFDLQRTIRK